MARGEVAGALFPHHGYFVLLEEFEQVRSWLHWQEQNHARCRRDKASVVQELAEGKTDGLSSNRTLGFDQLMIGLVEQVAIQRLSFPGGTDRQPNNGAASLLQVLTIPMHQARLAPLSLGWLARLDLVALLMLRLDWNLGERRHGGKRHLF